MDKLKDGFAIIFRIIFGSILAQVFFISKAAVDYLLNFLFFSVCVYYLLQSKGSFVEGVKISDYFQNKNFLSLQTYYHLMRRQNKKYRNLLLNQSKGRFFVR